VLGRNSKGYTIMPTWPVARDIPQPDNKTVSIADEAARKLTQLAPNPRLRELAWRRMEPPVVCQVAFEPLSCAQPLPHRGGGSEVARRPKLARSLWRDPQRLPRSSRG